MLKEWYVPLLAISIIGYYLLPGLLRFLSHHRITDSNFKGRSLPTGAGILIWLLLLLLDVLCKFHIGPASIHTEWLLAVTMVSFSGLLDDLIGDKCIKGIPQHWKAWTEKGYITTGVIKAGAVGFAGFLLLWPEANGVWPFFFQLLLILLSTNALNLLDVRPGRAVKFYFGAVILLMWGSMLNGRFGVLHDQWLNVLSVCVGAGILAVPDLRGRLMLGDAGANVLGFTVGYGFIELSSIPVSIAALSFFVLLHLVTWRYSLSKWIEANRLLRWLDEAGRGRI